MLYCRSGRGTPCFTVEVGVERHALLQKWAWNTMLYSLTAEKLEQLHKTILMEQKKNTFYSEVSPGILGLYYSDVTYNCVLFISYHHLSVVIHQYSFPSWAGGAKIT